MLHSTNDETKKVNDNDNEFLDTLDTLDTDNNNTNKAASKAENDESVSALSGNTAFYYLMREAKLQWSFPTMEAMTPIVEAYQTRTGNYLRIKRSINDRFVRVFECREHLRCPFEICIAR